MSYTTQYADATNPAFLGRVQISICNAAVSIINELSTVAQHASRAAFAKLVLQNPVGWAANMASGIVADQATNNSSTDAQIDSRIAAIWNSYI